MGYSDTGQKTLEPENKLTNNRTKLSITLYSSVYKFSFWVVDRSHAEVRTEKYLCISVLCTVYVGMCWVGGISPPRCVLLGCYSHASPRGSTALERRVEWTGKEIQRTMDKEVKHHKRNLSEGWIDLRKTYDSVYKKWLTEGLNYWTSQRGL